MIRIVETIRGLKGWRRLAVALVAGALAALSMPPLGFWPFLFIGFPLLILLIDGARADAPGRRFVLGWIFGLGYFAAALHWIAFAFLVDAKTYLWMMPFAVGGLASFLALYWGLAVLAATWLWGPGLLRVLALAAMFALAEWLRGHLLTGFPWASPGLAADGMGGLAQAAALIGMNGLTLLIVLWAGLPVVLIARRHVIAAISLASLLPALWLWGEWRLAQADDGAVDGVSLRIVQPNIPQDEKWREGNAAPIFEKLLRLSLQPTEQRPDGISGITHVFWPESAVPFFIDESENAEAALAEALPDESVLILGALRRDGAGHVYNSILGFDGYANLVVRYDKWRLVPGGEFLPLARIIEPLGFRKVVTTPGNFTPGIGPVTIPVPGAPPAGFLICYEAIFPHRLVDAAERPQWLVNVTNDGWFGNSTGPWQHLAQARLRAIEQGLPVVRAANTGVSAIIDPHGRIRQQLGLGASGVIDGALPLSLGPTPYGRWQDSILFAMVAAALLTVVVGGLRAAKSG